MRMTALVSVSLLCALGNAGCSEATDEPAPRSKQSTSQIAYDESAIGHDATARDLEKEAKEPEDKEEVGPSELAEDDSSRVEGDETDDSDREFMIKKCEAAIEILTEGNGPGSPFADYGNAQLAKMDAQVRRDCPEMVGDLP